MRDPSRLRVLTAILLLTAAPALTPPATADAAWWDATGLDEDGDGVDDRLRGVEGTDALVRVIVDYAHPPGDTDIRAVEDAGGRVVHAVAIVPALVVDVPGHHLRALAALPGVVLVEEDMALHPTLDVSRGLVNADRARKETGLTGKGVTVAVLDSGIDAEHPDFKQRILARYDATLPRTVPQTLLGQPLPDAKPLNDRHGTHVAGIVAGDGSASRGRYAGIAPGAGLLDVRVFDENGDGSTSDVLAGIDWILTKRDALNVRIMQMSLGGNATDGTDALSRAVNVAAERGLLTVAAAGNAGPDAGTVGVPGVAARALTVGAVDKKGGIAEFSARGPTMDGRAKPELVAPGVAITSTVPRLSASRESYGAESGTSMAAPHVAGVAALVFEANASLTPGLAKWILTASTRATGPSPHVWHSAYGWGHLDAFAAVKAAQDPTFLTRAPYAETASRVPFDGESVNPLDQLAYETGRAQRVIPAPGALAGLVVLGAFAMGSAFRRRDA